VGSGEVEQVKNDMPEKNEKQLESMDSVRSVERKKNYM